LTHTFLFLARLLNWNFHFGTLVAISIHRIAVLRTTFAMFPSLGVRWKTILPLHEGQTPEFKSWEAIFQTRCPLLPSSSSQDPLVPQS
jgi:hypothetical protein